MNNGGDVADQMVREGMQVTEEAVKLSALGIKNLAAIALALAKDNPRVRGKTKLDHLLREGKELKVFPIKAKDLGEFKAQAKHYGVLFAAIKDKQSEGELIDVMAKAEDVSKLNRIFERMGYPVPETKVLERKKAPTRLQQESASMMRGLGAMQTNQTASIKRPSVRAAIKRLREVALHTAKTQAQEQTREAFTPEKER